MMDNGSTKRLGSFQLYEDGSLPPLRMKDLTGFCTARGRARHCPHCDWSGGWEIALNEEDPNDTNPKLDIFILPTMSNSKHTASALICPNCGHLAMISTYKIRQYMDAKDALNE